jgi:hypothetical protein
LWTYPASEAIDVPPQTSIRIQFDRFLAPDSAVRQAICIQVEDPTNTNAACLANLVPEYDPVDRVAVWKNAALLPNQRHNVRLLVPANADDPTGVRAFDGVPLEKEYKFAFKTGPGPNPAFVEPDRTTNAGFCASSQCTLPAMGCTPQSQFALVQGPKDYLTYGCGASCHTTTYPIANVFPLVPKGGSLTAIPDTIRTLVMQATVATESATGPDPTVPRRSPKDVFGENMPYIDAHSPGNSFLLYKVLLGMPPRCKNGLPVNEESANPQFAGLACGAVNATADTYACKSIGCGPDGGAVAPADAGPTATSGQMVPPLVASWVPESEWKPPVPGEYDRLRLRVRGDPMPQGIPAAYQNVVALSAWIAAGASVDCPP